MRRLQRQSASLGLVLACLCPVAHAQQPSDATTPAAASSAAPAPIAAVAAPAAVEASRRWALRLPAEEKVAFRGVVNHDTAGLAAHGMLYGPGVAGALVGLVVHGLVNSSLKDGQKRRMQEEADATLLPFAPVLSSFTHQRLMGSGLARLDLSGRARLVGAVDVASAEWTIESAPVFAMTADRRALVLDNLVRVFAPGSAVPTYVHTLRVVSAPIDKPASDAPEAASAWMADDGRVLIDTSVGLFAESLDLVIAESLRAPPPPAGPGVEPEAPPMSAYRSFRYALGADEKVERALPVRQRCDRAVIRTLRGWLMSIPQRADPSSTACAPVAPVVAGASAPAQ